MTDRHGDGMTVGTLARLLAHGWWLIAALVILGAVVGGVVAKTSARDYEATATVYLGQPTDANGNAISGVSSNPKGAVELARSQAVLSRAAASVGEGLTWTKLRENLTLSTPTTQTRTSSSPTNFVTITVSDRSARRAAAAANAVASGFVGQLSSFVNDKITLFNQEIAADEQRIALADKQVADAQAALAAIAKSSISPAERAMASAPYMTIVQAASSTAEQAQQSLAATQLSLAVAKAVEQPRVVGPAVPPSSPTGPSVVVDAFVGLLVGLVVGCVAAVALPRRRQSAAALAPSTSE
jgi:capsular polysaccharide biosynthesis protein